MNDREFLRIEIRASRSNVSDLIPRARAARAVPEKAPIARARSSSVRFLPTKILIIASRRLIRARMDSRAAAARDNLFCSPREEILMAGKSGINRRPLVRLTRTMGAVACVMDPIYD